MTLTLNLPPEQEAELYDIAAQKGQPAITFAHEVFAAGLAKFRTEQHIPADAPFSTEVELTPEEEAEAISVGLDASFAGRVTPLAEWSAKFRVRHNIPDGVTPMTHEEAMRLP